MQSIIEISLTQDTNSFLRDVMQMWIDFKNLYSDTEKLPIMGCILIRIQIC